jgi:hypothetical protein
MMTPRFPPKTDRFELASALLAEIDWDDMAKTMFAFDGAVMAGLEAAEGRLGRFKSWTSHANETKEMLSREYALGVSDRRCLMYTAGSLYVASVCHGLLPRNRGELVAWSTLKGSPRDLLLGLIDIFAPGVTQDEPR